jgi:Mg2+/Co2+ transporter CorC
MKEIKFIPGSTVEQAVSILRNHRYNGEIVCGEFNGVMLYSNTVTMDSAYKEITGKSKEEFDKYVESLYNK